MRKFYCMFFSTRTGKVYAEYTLEAENEVLARVKASIEFDTKKKYTPSLKRISNVCFDIVEV